MISDGALANIHYKIEQNAIDDEHRYDYLFSSFKIPVIMCVTDDDCSEIYINSRNLNEAECNLVSWANVEKYRIQYGYDHYKEIGPCLK